MKFRTALESETSQVNDIQALINETVGKLMTAIPAFAEQNCEN